MAKLGWLVGLIVLITSVALSGALIRFRTCGVCDGFVMAVKKRSSSSRVPLPVIDCPDCDDRGTVSLFRSWRPSVSEPVRNIVRGILDAAHNDSMEAINRMLRNEGMVSDRAVRFEAPHWQRTMWIRFVRAEGRSYLVYLVDSPSATIPGTSGAGIILVHPQGRVLDNVYMTCSSREADLYAEILDKPAPDGARMRILAETHASVTRITCSIDQWQRDPRQATAEATGKPELVEVGRIGIRGDRLTVLSPERK